MLVKKREIGYTPGCVIYLNEMELAALREVLEDYDQCATQEMDQVQDKDSYPIANELRSRLEALR